MRHPPVNVVWQTHVAIVTAGCRGQVHDFPIAIIPLRIGPSRIVADVKVPGTVEENGLSAQRWRIRATSALQGDDHDRPRQHGRKGDPDTQRI